MSPADFLARANHQLLAMKAMKTKHVAVGVLANSATGRIYSSGSNVLQVAVANELGTTRIPQRSFLKMPQELKATELGVFIRKQMFKVLDGMQVEQGLGLIGTYAVNLSQDAFSTGGFGKWPTLAASTIEAKGSSGILIDQGVLKNSVSYEVR
jgi:hypothetical protein